MLFVLAILTTGCDDKEARKRNAKSPLDVIKEDIENTQQAESHKTPPKIEYKILENGEPNFVTVQHILLSFDKVYETDVDRTKDEAVELANEILKRAKDGEDFAEMFEEYSDDRGLVYRIVNGGELGFKYAPDRSLSIYRRDELATGFGDISFSLEVGEVGLAEYNKETCKYGWHVIKRIK